MLRIATAAIASLALASCATGSTEPAETAYNFGGVFDDTYAGEIDRTVVPRRPDGPPNVVLIIADDLGWPYMGFLGDRNVITPNMDVLGNGGAVFEVGHSTANHCRPTLQSLITGLYPPQYDQRARAIADRKMASEPLPAGVDTPKERSILHRQYETSAIEEFATLPRVLAKNGYVSHQSGKWWEQSYKHGGFTHGMTGTWSWEQAAQLGDNWFFTFMGGQGMEIGRTTMAPVTNFIEENADQPFFVWYGPALPHVPLNPPDRFYKYFENREGMSESAKLYYANIMWFDWGVGELIDSLRQQRVLDNTLIVYINDNGWEQAAGVEYADNHVTFANGGPRGKGSFFETGFRTPIIFYWQGKIHAIRDTKTLVSAVDVMPTILDYVGMDAPSGLPGASLRGQIEGTATAAPRDHIIGKLTQHRAGTNFRGEPDTSTEDHMGAALAGYYRRDAQWHFVWMHETGETALYDLVNDPGQRKDASAQNAALVEGFKADINRWRERFE